MFSFQDLFQSAGQRPIEETCCERADPPGYLPPPLSAADVSFAVYH